MNLTLQDTSLNLEILFDFLKPNEDPNIKYFAISRIKTIAKFLDKSKIQSELVPRLRQILKGYDPDEENYQELSATLERFDHDLTYNVRNYLEPFRIVLAVVEARQPNPKQVDYEFRNIYDTLRLGQEERNVMTNMKLYMKAKFVTEHKKALEARTDFIGTTFEDHAQYFTPVILENNIHAHQQYRKHLMHCPNEEKKVLIHAHLGFILDKLNSKEDSLKKLINYLHMVELFVETDQLAMDLNKYQNRVIRTAVGVLNLPNLQVQNRALRIIALNCMYSEESYGVLFQALKLYHTEEDTKFQYILCLLDTQNLFLIRTLLRFVYNLINCATNPKNFMKVITQCIECELMDKLDDIKRKITERKYRIYQSYDQYTNFEKEETMRIDKIELRNDTEFTKLKQQIITHINKLKRKFTDLEQGKFTIEDDIRTKRDELKRRISFIEQRSKLESDQIDQSPIKKNLKYQQKSDRLSGKDQNKRDSDVTKTEETTELEIPNTTYSQIILSYESQLKDKANQVDCLNEEIKNLKEMVEEFINTKAHEIKKQKQMLERENRELIQEIQKLQTENKDLMKDINRLKEQNQMFAAKSGIIHTMFSQNTIINNLEKNQYSKQITLNLNIPPNPTVPNLIKQQSQQPSLLPPPPNLMNDLQQSSTSLSILPPPPMDLLSLPTVELPPPPGLSLPTLLPSLNNKKRLKVEPTIQMKTLSWQVIDTKRLKNTFWQNLEDVDFDYKALELAFGQKKTKEVKSTTILPLVQKKTFITPDRARNIELIIQKLKINHEVLPRAVYSFDQSILTYSTIMSLSAIVPVAQEMQIYKGMKPDEKLMIPDRFLATVCNIKGYELRLKSMKFKADFRDMAEEFDRRLTYFKNFYVELRNDVLLQTILNYSLSIGNFLNAQSVKGGAYGFRLESLATITDMKYDNNNRSLLSFVISEIRKHQPEILKFEYIQCEYSDLLISLKVLGQDLKDFKSSLGNLQKCLLEIEESQQDKMNQFFFKFYTDVKKQIKRMEEDYQVADQIFKQAQEYYADTNDSEKIMEIIMAFRNKLKHELKRK